jgi:hypothetical protein
MGRRWSERAHLAVRAALLHPGVSLATVRFQLSGGTEEADGSKSLDACPGPRSSRGSLDDYTVLVGSKEENSRREPPYGSTPMGTAGDRLCLLSGTADVEKEAPGWVNFR